MGVHVRICLSAWSTCFCYRDDIHTLCTSHRNSIRKKRGVKDETYTFYQVILILLNLTFLKRVWVRLCGPTDRAIQECFEWKLNHRKKNFLKSHIYISNFNYSFTVCLTLSYSCKRQILFCIKCFKHTDLHFENVKINFLHWQLITFDSILISRNAQRKKKRILQTADRHSQRQNDFQLCFLLNVISP